MDANQRSPPMKAPPPPTAINFILSAPKGMARKEAGDANSATAINYDSDSSSTSGTVCSTVPTFSEQDLVALVHWLATVPCTMTKKNVNICRDFSDGVLTAKIVAHFFPKLIELHNYSPANQISRKMANWELLNKKVLPKLGIKLAPSTIQAICNAKAGYIERVLCQIRLLIVKRSEEEELAREMANRSGDGSEQDLHEVNCLLHLHPHGQPEYVLYRSHKFVPETNLIAKEKENTELKAKLKEMNNKVHRLETLISLKETHLGDLTRQVQELRVKAGAKSRPSFSDDEDLPAF